MEGSNPKPVEIDGVVAPAKPAVGASPTGSLTPWPRGEARGCNPRHGGSNPSGVSSQTGKQRVRCSRSRKSLRGGRDRRDLSIVPRTERSIET